MKFSLRSCSNANAVWKVNLAQYDQTQVNYMRESCISVDQNDQILGSISKEESHNSSQLVLHRAFSVFSFSKDNKLLMQKRSNQKITFPNLWTNTCCSHPLYNDREMEGVIGAKRAAIRKLKHELGIVDVAKDDLNLQGRYIYRAEMEDAPWGEHELDYAIILRGVGIERCHINENEVSDVKEVKFDELRSWMENEPQSFTPWLRLFVRTKTFEKWWTMRSVPGNEDHNIYKLN